MPVSCLRFNAPETITVIASVAKQPGGQIVPTPVSLRLWTTHPRSGPDAIQRLGDLGVVAGAEQAQVHEQRPEPIDR